jgi:hypothetical protein
VIEKRVAAFLAIARRHADDAQLPALAGREFSGFTFSVSWRGPRVPALLSSHRFCCIAS